MSNTSGQGVSVNFVTSTDPRDLASAGFAADARKNVEVHSDNSGSAFDAAELPNQAELAQTFVTFSDTLTEEFGVDASLAHLVQVCQQLVTDAEISVVIVDDSGKLRVAAASCERKQVLEQYQIDHNEGPTVETFRSGEPSTVEHFDADGEQATQFGQLAKVVGYHAIQSIPLRLRGETIGVLSLAETSSRTRSPLQFALLKALADGTTIGIMNHRAYSTSNELSRQLQGALTSRVLIEQSKGAVAARLGITVDEAFDMLRRYARGSNRKLNDVSKAIIDGTLATHELWGSRKAPSSGPIGRTA